METRPKKELGQNFLRSQDIVEQLVHASAPKATDIYLEIGPGRGAVTVKLAPLVKKITAVEIDKDIIQALKKKLAGSPNVEVFNADVLKFLRYQHSHHDIGFNKVIGSIPYQITSPLLHQLAVFSRRRSLDIIVLLLQKEVGEKLVKTAPSANYLSNFVQNFFSVAVVKNVPKEYFYPVPKVDGVIVKLIQSNSAGMKIDPEIWSSFLHQGFRHPRKVLKSNFDEKILLKAGINPGLRAESLEIKEWLELFKTMGRIPKVC